MQDFIGKERACLPEGGQEINSDLWMSLLMALLRQRTEGPPQLFSFGSLRLLADHLLPHLIDNTKLPALPSDITQKLFIGHGILLMELTSLIINGKGFGKVDSEGQRLSTQNVPFPVVKSRE